MMYRFYWRTFGPLMHLRFKGTGTREDNARWRHVPFFSRNDLPHVQKKNGGKQQKTPNQNKKHKKQQKTCQKKTQQALGSPF